MAQSTQWGHVERGQLNPRPPGLHSDSLSSAESVYSIVSVKVQSVLMLANIE